MKPPSLSRIALLTCALAFAGFGRATADDTGSGATSTSCHWHHHDSALTSDERAELKKDRDQVFDSNPDLKTEGKALWEQRKTMKDASDSDKQAFHEKWHAYHQKLETAIEGVDPNAAALIAKVKAAHHHHHDADADSNSGSDDSNQ
jgi:hypothetical protein